MPRKTASKLENTELNELKEPVVEKKTTKRKTATKKTTSKTSKNATTNIKSTKSTTVKKSASKKTNSSSDMLSKTTSTSTKTTRKKTTTTRKSSTTKASSSKVSKKNKITVDEITPTTNLTKKIEVIEYYDLPYRYNQTVVRVLAQTPTTLFIYWDISDIDRANFVKQYGEDFFNNTKPVLIIHNNSMHYSFEIDIDDFANSWYLHVNDANCEYSVELGRRPKYYNNEKHIDIPNNYLYVTSSNIIEAPNDHVLFDRDMKTVYFKDIKTNIVTAKDVTSISFLRNIGRIYSLYDLQSDFNKNSWIDSNLWQLDLKNPSSSSSTFK